MTNRYRFPVGKEFRKPSPFTTFPRSSLRPGTVIGGNSAVDDYKFDVPRDKFYVLKEDGTLQGFSEPRDAFKFGKSIQSGSRNLRREKSNF